jgi:hypothetical protein
MFVWGCLFGDVCVGTGALARPSLRRDSRPRLSSRAKLGSRLRPKQLWVRQPRYFRSDYRVPDPACVGLQFTQ